MSEDVRILVIDDEQSIIGQFERMLTDEGYKVYQAKSGEEAEKIIISEPLNIVITDVNLPDIENKEWIKKIRQANKYAFIVVTADYADIAAATQSLKLGANDYIGKPFDPRDTILTLRALVEKQKLKADNIQLLETIKSLALALEARDPYTLGHSEQVTAYSVAIAERMKLSREEIERIREAGLLHDIGKIGITDAILLKPDRLTAEEYDKIKEHPEIGKRILAPVRSLADKIPFIYYHHERYDGKGYPEGLKGEKIPLGARIIAVADTFQAMTSDRPYRKALSRQIAIDELNHNKGTQFDPKIVDEFLAIVDAIKL